MTHPASPLVTQPTTPPSPAATPTRDDDVLFDPADDLLPPPKPAERSPARTTVTSLTVVRS